MGTTKAPPQPDKPQPQEGPGWLALTVASHNDAVELYRLESGGRDLCFDGRLAALEGEPGTYEERLRDRIAYYVREYRDIGGDVEALHDAVAGALAVERHGG